MDLTVPESEINVRYNTILVGCFFFKIAKRSLKFYLNCQGPVDDCAVVEHHLSHPLLRDNAQLIIPPTGNRENFAQIVRGLFEVTTPVVIYGISSDILSNDVCFCPRWL